MHSVFCAPSSKTWQFMSWAWSCGFSVNETLSYDRSRVGPQFTLTHRMLITAFAAMDIDYACYLVETNVLAFSQYASDLKRNAPWT